MINLRLYNIENISETAQQFLDSTRGFKKFAFYGDMGAGKTTFIIALCKQLGAVDVINSPTFTIINEYRTSNGSVIYHFDFYRIKSVDELLAIGIEDYFYEDVYSFIEWPEKAENILPQNIVRVHIKEIDKDKRELEIDI
jgi:tRNA threonylcarbamoyladenosine biosynthesis protein TsaE